MIYEKVMVGFCVPIGIYGPVLWPTLTALAYETSDGSLPAELRTDAEEDLSQRGDPKAEVATAVTCCCLFWTVSGHCAPYRQLRTH